MTVTRSITACALLTAAMLLGGCQGMDRPGLSRAAVVVEQEPTDGWRSVITSQDRARIDALDTAWNDGLAAARPRFARRIAQEGALLRPDAALPHAMLPPGSYRCRLIRLGASGRVAAFSALRTFFCHVGGEDGLLAFTKQTGSDRPGGYLYPDTDRRSIFLGGQAGSGNGPPPAYGETAGTNVVGVVERVEPFRYRLVMPRPQNGAAIEIMELIPAVPLASLDEGRSR